MAHYVLHETGKLFKMSERRTPDDVLDTLRNGRPEKVVGRACWLDESDLTKFRPSPRWNVAREPLLWNDDPRRKRKW
jgi:hypothetical protein